MQLPFTPKSERSRQIYEALIPLASEGLRAVDIARQLGLPLSTVRSRTSTLIREGVLPRARVRKGRSIRDTALETRELRRKYEVKTGNFRDIIRGLSVEQAEWLYRECPQGSSLARFISSIIIDAYHEEGK